MLAKLRLRKYRGAMPDWRDGLHLILAETVRSCFGETG
jgi:hypothetical protein